MGKAKEAVDSDYSGRPLGRPTREEVAAGNPGPGTFLGTDLPDGRYALVGPGGKLFYEHFEDGQPVWDRPVNLEDYEWCAPFPLVALHSKQWLARRTRRENSPRISFHRVN